MVTLTVGVDVGHKGLDMATGMRGIAPSHHGSFANTAAGFQALAKLVEAEVQRTQADAIQLVLEPTGGYEQPLAHFALAQGWKVCLPNPRQVREWGRGMGWRAKTDRQDALLLALYGSERDLPSWTPLPESVAELDTLLARREDLKGMLRQEQNRRHALQAQEAYRGRVAESLERSLAWLEQAIAEIEEAIGQHMDQHPDLKEQAKRLRTIPGVGERSVLSLLVLMFRWGTLTNYQGDHKGLTAFVGLDPRCHDSGTSVHRRATISRTGDPVARSLLYMGAFGGVRGHNALREFYQRLVAAGKPKKLALVAAARKILVWAWAVFRSQTTFIPELARAA